MRIQGLVTLALVSALPARAQEPPMPGSATEQFVPGETLEFEGRFGPIRLGRAYMEVLGVDSVRGEPTLHFRFRLDANLAGVYRIQNRFDSWVGLEDFLSRRFVQEFNESTQQRTNEYEIYPDSGFYTRPDVDTALTTSVDPLDDTAFFYFVRTLNLVPGDSLAFDRYFRPDRNPVIIQVLEKDTVDVPAGRFTTTVIHPIIKGGGIFKESSEGRMWITDDERRLIVQMKIKFGFGTVTLRLRDIRGVSASDTANSG